MQYFLLNILLRLQVAVAPQQILHSHQRQGRQRHLQHREIVCERHREYLVRFPDPDEFGRPRLKRQVHEQLYYRENYRYYFEGVTIHEYFKVGHHDDNLVANAADGPHAILFSILADCILAFEPVKAKIRDNTALKNSVKVPDEVLAYREVKVILTSLV